MSISYAIQLQVLLHLIYTGVAGVMTLNICGDYGRSDAYCNNCSSTTASSDIILVRNAPCYVSCDISPGIDCPNGYTGHSPSPSPRSTNNPNDGGTTYFNAINITL